MYPLLNNDGAQIKKYLIQHKIFVPTLWPNILSLPEYSYEYYLANNLVLLPIDQRYSVTDMKYVLDVLNNFNK